MPTHRILHGLNRTELNGAEVEVLVVSPGLELTRLQAEDRSKVRLLTSGKTFNVPNKNLMVSKAVAAATPWENCRHGGPPNDPVIIGSLTRVLANSAFETSTAPCLEHARLLMPLLRQEELPSKLLASLGVDAFIAGDWMSARSFATFAVLSRVREGAGYDALSAELHSDETHKKRRDRLLTRWAKGKCAICLSQLADSSIESTLSRMCANCGTAAPAKRCVCKLVRYCDTTCQTEHWPAHKAVCKQARAAGLDLVVRFPCGHALHQACLDGQQESEITCCPYCARPLSPLLGSIEAQFAIIAGGGEPMRELLQEFTTCQCLQIAAARGLAAAPKIAQASVVDEAWDDESAVVVLPTLSEDGLRDGAKLARISLAVLVTDTKLSRRAMCLLKKIVGSLTKEDDAGGRGGQRDRSLKTMQIKAVAAAAIVAAGGVQLIADALQRSLDSFVGLGPHTIDNGDIGAIVSPLEIIASVGSELLGLELLRSGVVDKLCLLCERHRSSLPVCHNVFRALLSIVGAVESNEWNTLTFKSVVNEAAAMIAELMEEDILDFSCLDSIIGLVTTLAGGSAELAQLVAKSTPRKNKKATIPVSLCLVVVQHAHEQRDNRFLANHPLGQLQHIMPIQMALECLYVLSFHCDIRAVQLGVGDDGSTEPFSEALIEYSDFLLGLFKHNVVSPKTEAQLLRLLDDRRRARSAKPEVENMLSQQRRLLHACAAQELKRTK